MKNFLFVLAIVFLSSCSTKFKVGADYKEVTVVYGLLSTSDTAHYIKITKGYFSETLNNLELAKSADSIYFSNLQVTMEALNNGNVVQTITLDKVDLNLEGYPKDSGTFATAPNYAYKFKNNLDANKTYRLKVKDLATGKEIQGETPVISTSPSDFRFVAPGDQTEQLNFADPNFPYPFEWKGPEAAAFYDVVVQFKYQEVNTNHVPIDTVYIEKDIPVLQNVLATTGDINVSLTSVNFFKQLNSAVGDAPYYIKRYVDTPGLMILAGGQELKTYIDVNSAQGGITYDQIKPNYTNLKGDNVFGILSTRGQIGYDKIKFNDATIDSIENGAYTKSLRIVGISNK